MTERPVDEVIARACVARRMNLQKDPLGQRLPDELWRQGLMYADAVFDGLNSIGYRIIDAVTVKKMESCDDACPKCRGHDSAAYDEYVSED